jgi:GH18 family chitinase
VHCIDLFIRGNLPTGGWPDQAGGAGAAAGLFDGINLDWEFPGVDPGNGAHYSPADRINARALLQEFRRQLDQAGRSTGKHYTLTNDIPGGNVNSAGSWQLRNVAQIVDGPMPGNDTPSYHDLVDTGLADANLTPIGPTAATGNGAGSNGFTRYFSLRAASPWLYNPALNGGTFISYVDPQAVALRMALVDRLDLRGAWAWEISNDDNANDLVNAMTKEDDDD